MLEKERDAIAQLAAISNEKVAVSFSGGKDSLVALDLAYRVGVRRVVFADTTIEFEETTEFIRSLREFYGIHIDVVKAPISFFEMVDQVGIPSKRLRWCCDVFKFAPLANYARHNNLDGFITGLRKEESNRRRGYGRTGMNPLIPVEQINPILDWTEEDVWGYISNNGLPVNPLYQYFGRIGCWCCPFKSDDEWEQIAKLYPDKAARFEGTLLDFALKQNIPDKDRFISGRGWRSWASPLKKISIGLYSPCQAGSKDRIDLIFSGQSQTQVQRIVKILPILTDDFFAVKDRLRITLKDVEKQKLKLNILVEKALNCRSCGACTALCRSGALMVDGDSLVVDRNKCTKCGICITTRVLRGSCIMRNYSPKRASLV